MIEVSWSQSVAALSDIFSDGCSDLNTHWNHSTPTAWGVNNNYFQARSTTADSDPARVITIKSGQPLAGYSLVTISWDQRVSGTALQTDGLDFALSSDGTNFDAYNQAFRGPISSWVHKSYTIPGDFSSSYLNNNFKIKFKVVSFTGSAYCQIDNIKITPSYSSSDGLYFALYNGTSWSSNIQAFRGDIGSSWVNYSYTTTDTQYLKANFKLRFYLVGMSDAGKYCNLDNIKIIVRPPDTSITFKINDVQYSLSDNGTPQQGGELTASESSIIVNTTGYSYACYRKVTALVQKYPEVYGEQHHTGNYKYTVGSVQADTGNQISYAGWSIIIVYSSPQTAGHYLYLRDIFSYTSGDEDLDFDNDGVPGGDITGFVIPEPLKDRFGVIQDPVCAHLTCFIGEGDWCYSGDFIALNAPEEYRDNPEDIPNQYKLYDGIPLDATTTGGGDPHLPNNASQPDNVWNSQSVGMSEDGVDIDTFEITWASQLLKPGDTKLHLDIYTYVDNWNTIYFIISVKSKTVTGGTGHYVIYGS
jgi:hypothetical protein